MSYHMEMKLFNDVISITQDTRNKIFCLKKLHLSLARVHNQIIFLKRCCDNNIIPKTFLLKLPIKGKRSHLLQNKIGLLILKECLSNLIYKKSKLLSNEIRVRCEIVWLVHPHEWSIIWNYISTLEKACFISTRNKCMSKFSHLKNIESNKYFNQDITTVTNLNLNSVVNLSSRNINHIEQKVLQKGLSFIPSIKKVNMTDIAVNLEVVGSKNSLDSVPMLVKNIIKHKNLGKNNLSKEEFTAINNLKSDNSIVIQNSDKGKNVVIIDKLDYDTKLQDIINSTSYTQLETDPTIDITKKLNAIFKTYRHTKDFPKKLSKTLKTGFARHPAIYGQVKIHKIDKPLRPIISNYNTILEASAKYLGKILKRYTNPSPINTIVKNSKEVINNIRRTNVYKDVILVSFDVINLFGSLNIQECINLIVGLIDNDANIELDHQVPKGFIKKLFILCIETSYFIYDNKFYQQNKGVPMGSSISPIIADIFMTSIEIKIFQLNLAKYIKLWNRYVDDILSFWAGTLDNLNKFKDDINDISEHIKFTMELENSDSISFLDFRLIKNQNGIHCEMYSKPTDSGIITNYNSYNPPHVKSNIIKSQIARISNISDNLDKDFNILTEKFVRNGYPKQLMISNITHRNQINSKVSNDDQNKKLLILPYMGKTSNNIKKAVANLNVKLVSKNNRSLGNTFSRSFKYNTNVKAGVIYKINCSCGEFYIGETGRLLNIRIEEHKRAVKNRYMHYALTNHLYHNNNHTVDFDNVEVLGYEYNLEKRKIKEALFIKRLNPSINLNKGVELRGDWDDIRLGTV